MEAGLATTLVLAHPIPLGPVAGTTVLIRALLRELPALDDRLRTAYLDLDAHAAPAAWLSRLRSARRGGLRLLGVNLHLERHSARSIECYELCRREDVPAYVWVHDYWPHHEQTVRRLVEELDVVLLASTPCVRDGLAEDGFSARVVQVGISLANLVAEPSRRPVSDPFVVGTVGRLVGRKRHGDVVRAFTRARLGAAAQLRLRLLPSLVYPAPADAALLAEVVRDVAAIPTGGGTVVIEREATVRQDYGPYSVYVCASDYEGFSMTPIEAIYCGCPALMSDIPAHREIATVLLGDDSGGVLFPPGDVDALVDLLRDEALTGRRRARLLDRSHEIRTVIDERWSTRQMGRALLDVLGLHRTQDGARTYGRAI